MKRCLHIDDVNRNLYLLCIKKGRSSFKKICFALLRCKFIQQDTPKSNQIIHSVGGSCGVSRKVFSPCVAVVLMCSNEWVDTKKKEQTKKKKKKNGLNQTSYTSGQCVI